MWVPWDLNTGNGLPFLLPKCKACAPSFPQQRRQVHGSSNAAKGSQAKKVVGWPAGRIRLPSWQMVWPRAKAVNRWASTLKSMAQMHWKKPSHRQNPYGPPEPLSAGGQVVLFTPFLHWLLTLGLWGGKVMQWYWITIYIYIYICVQWCVYT